MKKLDPDANVWLRGAVDIYAKSQRRDIRVYENYDIKNFKRFYPPWKGTVHPIEYFATKILEPEREKKFNANKKAFLENKFTEPTFICIKGAGKHDPVMIIDGNHRAIGLMRAFEEHSGVLSTVSIRVIMFSAEKMNEFDEYNYLLSAVDKSPKST